MAQLVELLVDVGVFLYIEVGSRDVGFRLVVVVVADEVLDGVLGEEFLELGRQLRRERLVVGDDDGGALDALYDVRHRERLAAAGDAHERLMRQAVRDAVDDSLHRLRLVAGGLKIGYYLELWHGTPLGFAYLPPIIASRRKRAG